jgi:hypothetical protein
MKPPSEADLQELENKVLYHWRTTADNTYCFGQADRIVRTLEYLIAMARDPSKLLRTIPDDDALDRSLAYVRKAFPPPVIPPRKAKLEPVLSLQPKQKSKSKNR